MVQTRYVAERLESYWEGLTCEIVPFSTKGDETQAAGIPLPKIGGKGLFTAELEAALRNNHIDIAVHSLKDLPVDNPDELIVGAIPERVDPRDVLVSKGGSSLDSLPEGAVVGTSSLRRQSQILAYRPDLIVRSIRGNVDTRLRKVKEGDYDAAILAAAGLIRLGLDGEVSDWLSYEIMLPAPGQGALGVQCRESDKETLRILAPIHDEETATAVAAERHFLQGLGGGCSLPVGAFAQQTEDQVDLVGRVFSIDGIKRVAVRLAGHDSVKLGHELADIALRSGAGKLLSKPSLLKGKRVVVTRSPHQARAFSEKLLEREAFPIEFPTLKLIRLPAVDFEHFDFNAFDWVVFTSGNA
ncbi:MAG: hydroxymethylbilane synthase, partial [Chloroflexota bacterium]